MKADTAQAKKWRTAAGVAIATGKMATTLAKALARGHKGRWKFVDFASSAGVVDILAIRKSSKPPPLQGLKKLDAFEVIVIQVKGGSARPPTEEDVERLRLVAQHHRATRIALFNWVKDRETGYYLLEGKDWKSVTMAELFR